MVLVALPLVVMTFGLAILFINAVLYFIVGGLVGGFYVASFGAAFWGAFWVSAFTFVFNGWITGEKRSFRVHVGPGGSPGSGGPTRQQPTKRVAAKDDVIDI